MMDPSIAVQVVDRVLGPAVGGLCGYVNLKAYLRVVRRRVLGQTAEYHSENEFWRDALGPDYYEPSRRVLAEGRVVKLSGFQITDWFPRCPGLYWTAKAAEHRAAAHDYVERTMESNRLIVLGPHGKSLMVSGGIGTTRLGSHEGKGGDYRVLCATSSGTCDAGIPLVVREQVYERVRDQIQTEGAALSDIVGVYSALPIRYEDLVVATPGTELTGSLKAFLSTGYYVPRFCLLVESRLQVSRKRAAGALRATAWTLFKGRTLDASFPYSFTYYPINLRRESSINEAATFIQGYVSQHEGEQILTDFDERTPRLGPVYPIERVMTTGVDQLAEQHQMVDWAEKVVGIDAD